MTSARGHGAPRIDVEAAGFAEDSVFVDAKQRHHFIYSNGTPFLINEQSTESIQFAHHTAPRAGRFAGHALRHGPEGKRHAESPGRHRAASGMKATRAISICSIFPRR